MVSRTNAVAIVLVLVAAGLSCHDRFQPHYTPDAGDGGSDSGPCEGVTCSGHGRCFHDGETAMCVCDPGYEPDDLECVPGGGDGDADADSDREHGRDADMDQETDRDEPLACPDDMVPVPPEGFCIDRYEASVGGGGRAASVPGVLPWVRVNRDAASAACQLAGKRLCTAVEWQAACQGAD